MPTDEALRAMPQESLLNLYHNAKKIAGTPSDKRAVEAAKLVTQIERMKLQYRPVEGLRNDDPILLKIEEIIESTEGRAAVLRAVELGLPGLAGVEAMLIAELGDSYSARNTGTQAAGEFVGRVMGQAGYVKDRQGTMPEGSVAKTAMRYKPRVG